MIKNFWNRVKRHQRMKGYSQGQFCELCNFNIGSFRNKISRNLKPDIIEAYTISKVLNVTIEYLLTGEDSTTYAEQCKELERKIENAILALS